MICLAFATLASVAMARISRSLSAEEEVGVVLRMEGGEGEGEEEEGEELPPPKKPPKDMVGEV